MSIRFFAVFAVAVSTSWSATWLPPQSDYCDPALKYTRGDPNGYFMRPGRCEGRYRDESSGEAFLIMGYVVGERAFDPKSTNEVRLSWDATGGDSVQILGLSLSHKLPYRMDSRSPMAAERFTWPTDVLNELSLTGTDVGLRAWATVTRGGQRTRVMIPLYVGDRRSGRGASPRLVIRSVSALREAFLTVGDPQAGGAVTASLRRHLGVNDGPTFELALPEDLPAGHYRVNVGGVLADGSIRTTDAIISVPRRARDG